MTTIPSSSKTRGFGTFQFAKNIILPFLLGILFNIIFAFIFLFGWLNGAAILESPIAILVFLVFLFGFPFAYLWYVRIYTFRKGVEILFIKSQPLINSALNQIVASFVLGKAAIDKSPRIVGKSLYGVAVCVSNLDDKLPLAIQKLLAKLLESIPIVSTINEIKQQTTISEANLPLIQSKVRYQLTDYIQKEIIGVSALWLWGLILVNIITAFLAWTFA